MTDCQLLELYVGRRDSSAFRALVVRHGPAVMRVCRWVLRDPHEAEDAFQATFLVLVRRATTVEDPELLGNWLRGVAYRVASQSRRRVSKQRGREVQGVEMLPADEPHDSSLAELGVVLREELARMPEKYRGPMVLCYLEGLSHEQAAAQLRLPSGTVKVRLVRGRRLLRTRLDRRGVGLGLVLLFTLMSKRAVAVPPHLVESTVDVMRLGAAGKTVSLATRFGPAVALAEGSRRVGSPFGPCWGLLALVAILALSATGGTFALSHQGEVWARTTVQELPASLTDVLGVDCR